MARFGFRDQEYHRNRSGLSLLDEQPFIVGPCHATDEPIEICRGPNASKSIPRALEQGLRTSWELYFQPQTAETKCVGSAAEVADVVL